MTQCDHDLFVVSENICSNKCSWWGRPDKSELKTWVSKCKKCGTTVNREGLFPRDYSIFYAEWYNTDDLQEEMKSN